MISFFYLNQDLTAMAPKNAALLLYFVEFILSEEGQALAANKYNMFNKLPDALKKYNTKALATLKLPAGMVKLTSETDTLIWSGAADTVISKKRRSYAELERTRTAKALAKALDAAALGGASPSKAAASDPLAVAALAVGAAGLVLGLVGCLIALAAYMRATRTAKPRSAEIPVRELENYSATTDTKGGERA